MAELSIIMPVYNVAKFLPEAIDSILAQSFSDWELIIVDDASTDGSFQICKAYERNDGRIRVFSHEINKGLVSTLNYALRQTTGMYLARQDGDDISSNRRLELQISWLKHHPEFGLIGSSGWVIDETSAVVEVKMFPQNQQEIYQEIIDCKTPFFHGSWMMTRKAIERSGIYNQLLFSGEDKDLWLRISEQFKTGNLSDKLYYYRVHPHAFTSTTNHRRKVMRELVIELAKERKLLGSDSLGLKYGSFFNQGVISQRYVKLINGFLKSAGFLEKGKIISSFFTLLPFSLTVKKGIQRKLLFFLLRYQWMLTKKNISKTFYRKIGRKMSQLSLIF